VGGASIDIEDLISQVKKEAHALRMKAGPTAVRPEVPQIEALAALPLRKAPADLEDSVRPVVSSRLYNNIHPAEGAIHSHRGQLGRIIIFFKKFFRQMMRPALDRQAGFNQALIQSLEAMTAENLSAAKKIVDLQNEIIDLRSAVGVSDHSGFDYASFEDRYRGSWDHVTKMQSRYQDYFSQPADGPVLDLGCGRGEFLALLERNSVPCSGVDLDDSAVEFAQARGLRVEKRHLLQTLEDSIENSLGGIVSFQVVEHLPLAVISDLLALAKRKLRPDGFLILETVNVASLYTHANGE
jgi:2-polyprenyl-3-methyl-5-hydroxy-6-metoxy-1,4-benzoquinol methylase